MMRAAREYRCTGARSAAPSLCVHEWVGEASTAGPPLLLLHGFTGCGLAWERAVALLTEPGRIVAPDLPGHCGAAADARDCTFDAATRAIESALDGLGIERVDLHGYSMGGRLALYFALTRPVRVRRLSLESASAGLSTASDREARIRSDEMLARFACEAGIERFVDRWERTPVLASQLGIPAQDRARVRALRLRNSVEGLAASLRGMGTGAQPYLGNRLSELARPVLVMAGDEDAKFSTIARDLARAIPDSRLMLVPGAGHTPHLEQPGHWAAALDAFIAETERGESCRSSGIL
jgi:2-succinyl-6-hydroxy-2,4-cyclohexadiene-1-carboxylate synthase